MKFIDLVGVFQGYIDDDSIGEDVALALFLDIVIFMDWPEPPVDTEWKDLVEGDQYAPP